MPPCSIGCTVFQRTAVRQVQAERGVAFARRGRVQRIDQALGTLLRLQTDLDDAADQVGHAHAFQVKIRGQSQHLFQFAVRDHDAALGIEHAQAVRHVV
jgi:hypothetical protein